MHQLEDGQVMNTFDVFLTCFCQIDFSAIVDYRYGMDLMFSFCSVDGGNTEKSSDRVHVFTIKINHPCRIALI